MSRWGNWCNSGSKCLCTMLKVEFISNLAIVQNLGYSEGVERSMAQGFLFCREDGRQKMASKEISEVYTLFIAEDIQ